MPNPEFNTSRYNLLPPQLEDCEELAKMRAQSWIDTYPNDKLGISEDWVKNRVWERSLSEEGLARRKDQLKIALENPDKYFFLVARSNNDDIIGFVEGEKREAEQELLSLYVAKEYHGLGVAQELTDALLQWLDPQPDTVLDVASYNDRAINFYEKIGFEIIPGSDDVYADTMPTIKMIRKGEAQ